MFELLAQAPNPEALAALMIPMIIFMIPIVAILTSHQRKMAELVHGKQQNHVLPSVDPNRIAALESEVARLRDTVSRQTIELDNLRMSVPTGQGSDELSTRINQ